MLVKSISMNNYQSKNIFQAKNNNDTNFKSSAISHIRFTDAEQKLVDTFIISYIKAAQRYFSKDIAINFGRFLAFEHLQFLKSLTDGHLDPEKYETFTRKIETKFEEYLQNN